MTFWQSLRRFLKALLAIITNSVATKATLVVGAKKRKMAEIRLIPGGPAKRLRLEGSKNGAPAEFLDKPVFSADSDQIVISPIDNSDDVSVSAAEGADVHAVLTATATGADADGNPAQLSDSLDIDASAEEVPPEPNIATEAHIVVIEE